MSAKAGRFSLFLLAALLVIASFRSGRAQVNCAAANCNPFCRDVPLDNGLNVGSVYIGYSKVHAPGSTICTTLAQTAAGPPGAVVPREMVDVVSAGAPASLCAGDNPAEAKLQFKNNQNVIATIPRKSCNPQPLVGGVVEQIEVGQTRN